ncbi:MAG: S8 family serine peptidase [Acidimicrobiales bacterium]
MIDTGIAPVPGLDHADVVVGPDLSFEAGNPDLVGLDSYGHGTHMAGIIGARTPGVNPVDAGPTDTFGIAPGARLVSVKVGDNTGAVDVSQVIAAIDWVVANRATGDLDIGVLNLSYTTSSDLGYIDDPLSKAVENAWKAGIVVVVSAGNDGRGVKELANPANNPYVIAVGAAQNSDGKWKVPSWATRGDSTRNPDVVAPGASIASLRVPGSRVDTDTGRIPGHPTLFKGSGTSQAAAVVSGAAALLLQHNPDLTPDQVKAALTDTAVWIHDDDSRQGHGLINIAAAATAEVSATAAQTWEPSTGLGALEAARGDDHVTINGITLRGEITFNGQTWNPDTWTKTSPTGSSWTGSSWTGSSWTGSSWTGSSWTGSSWTGSSWSGSSWTGSSWSGSSWTGNGWQ